MTSKMTIYTVAVNVVVVAQQFNPSILDKHWMITNGIISEDEFTPNCIFAPMVSQINAKDFQLLVLPEQLQFIPKEIGEHTQQLIIDKLFMIIDKLPHTPYIAMGLNFSWNIGPIESDFAEFNRSLFFMDNNPIHKEFKNSDCRYGAYLSKNIFECRLKLDIKPIQIQLKDVEKKTEALALAFNFHKDLLQEGKKIQEIKALINNWDKARKYSEKILNYFI